MHFVKVGKETTSDLKKTFNENLKVISSDLKMYNASETRNLGRYQVSIYDLKPWSDQGTRVDYLELPVLFII